jgi:hypothetical protein
MGGFDQDRKRGARPGGGGPAPGKAAGPGKQTMVDQARAGVAGGGRPLPFLAQIQAAFGPEHDVSGITAHIGGEAAEATDAIGAEAYATGDQVAFRQAPDLHTAAHEAAHVIQQRAGVQLLGGVGKDDDAYERNADAVADRVVAGQSAADLLPSGSARAGGGGPAVQLRRVPVNGGSILTDPGDASKQGENYAANSAGLKRLIEHAERALKPDEKAKVETAMLAGQSKAEFAKLPEHQRLARHAAAIVKIKPDLALGDPNLIDTGPRPATDDAKNMKQLVANANKIFDAVAAGHESDLEDVFGAANVAAARAKYAKGKKWMNDLFKTDHVVTDRSGYSKEVGLGGLTGFQRQIALSPGTIDNPDENESIITMIHEACHAGNADVKDKGYITQPSFTELAEAVKLGNAAHFEVVPRRILGAKHSFPGKKFVPAGTSSGGVTAPKLTPAEEAIRACSETLRQAWTIGLNLHKLYLTAFKDPATWNADRGGGKKLKHGLPYWSKVQKLTIHEKGTIDPSSKNAAVQPVSTIDMALSESCTRQLALAMFAVPKTEADADTLEAGVPEADRKAAHASVDTHRDLLLKLVVSKPGVAPITGTPARDLRVVAELAKLVWGTVLDKRDPSGFAD